MRSDGKPLIFLEGGDNVSVLEVIALLNLLAVVIFGVIAVFQTKK